MSENALATPKEATKEKVAGTTKDRIRGCGKFVVEAAGMAVDSI